jgi:hypothetical protein
MKPNGVQRHTKVKVKLIATEDKTRSFQESVWQQTDSCASTNQGYG